MTKILVVDDEKNIVELITMNLEDSGYEVIGAYNGMEAITKINNSLPDLILLDLMLPDINGLQICKMIRLNEDTKDIPVIMVTAKSEEDDKIKGLSIGADDYITKPFSLKELEVRIQTVLRRSKKTTIEVPKSIQEEKILKYKDLTIYMDKFILMREDEEIELTLTEFKILKVLMENGKNVSLRETLLEKIGIDNSKTIGRVLDVHIRNLRKKLNNNSKQEYIETIRGIGYKMK